MDDEKPLARQLGMVSVAVLFHFSNIKADVPLLPRSFHNVHTPVNRNKAKIIDLTDCLSDFQTLLDERDWFLFPPFRSFY